VLTVLVDLGSGNLHSAEKAFQRMARETGAGEIRVTADPDTVARADRIALPGDGAFPACRAALDSRPALLEALVEAVERRCRPFLGICVGMQLMASVGREHRDTPGLGWIGGEVVRIDPGDGRLKVPHMGWNDLVVERRHPVLEGIETGAHVYFVHSYQLDCTEPSDRLAWADYGCAVTAVVGRDTMVGSQFHPEKSQRPGLRLIANFLTWTP
jgi:imidazole glycerol-phosphate synthase subunit HisH